jgi:hypothetical protein
MTNNNAATSTTEQEKNPGTDSEQFKLPENYDKGILYATIIRGNTKELAYASRATIEAMKDSKPLPSGTALTLEIYKDDVLSQIFVSEKRTGWGEQSSLEMHNGDWRYQAFNADKSVDYKGKIQSCISCHASQERQDYMYTSDQMKSFKLEDFISSKDDSTETRFAGYQLENWEVNALKDYLANLSSENS